ncbi:uncharacterized protein LOC125020531 [Mugil cephalus]|uniref:uncharacterized protein LOC125020531 n=1 Tax=Mugil cephalus TaxID=48193 RepID=UPI001FB72786|nr:uncharacterized protein LOC125020531 [Mugil cephalus]
MKKKKKKKDACGAGTHPGIWTVLDLNCARAETGDVSDEVHQNRPERTRAEQPACFYFIVGGGRHETLRRVHEPFSGEENMGKSRDLSEFERGMIVGARSAGCSISQTVNMLGFSKTAVSRVFREWCEKQKTSSRRELSGRKRLVDEAGEKMLERIMEANNQATDVQIQAMYNSSGPEKPISLRTTQRTLKRLGYSRKMQRQDVLVAAGLQALAVYSCPQQLETPTDSACGKQTDLKNESPTDTTSSNENDKKDVEAVT